MTLRARVEEFKALVRANVVQMLLEENYQHFQKICEKLYEMNPATQAYNYWVLFEMADEGIITIYEDRTIELHTIY